MNPTVPKPDPMADELILIEDAAVPAPRGNDAWKILIADDEPDVHMTTKLILRGFTFRGRNLEIFDAYSGAETCAILEAHPDMAVVFLDVVMESDDAGLLAVKRIREQLGNRMIRIVLRTGQPGHAPEESVVVDYDINDYRAKTELTARRLFTSLVSALRSYQDLQTIDTNRRSLEKILDALSNMDFRSRNRFTSGLLMQLGSLLEMGEPNLLLMRHDNPGEKRRIAAASGLFEPFVGDAIYDVLGAESIARIDQACASQSAFEGEDFSIYPIQLPARNDSVCLYIQGSQRIEGSELVLMSVFCEKIILAYDNYEAVEQSRLDQGAELAVIAELAHGTQESPITYALNRGRLARDMAVQLFATVWAGQADSEHLAATIERASLLADVGNLHLPPEILSIRSTLSGSQQAAVRQHPALGAALLDRAFAQAKGGRMMHLARSIALTHHERFDGTGYPHALAGTVIPPAGRIVAIADSYMALTSARPWRAALSHDTALTMIREGAGTQFDPLLVEAFLQVVEPYRPA